MSQTLKIEDAGKKIGGARKDWRQERLSIDDLNAMSEGEAIEHVLRDNIWPAPDYADLVEKGMSASQVAAIDLVRKRLSKTPNFLRGYTPNSIRRVYIQMIETYRDVLMDPDRCKTPQEIYSNTVAELKARNVPSEREIVSNRRSSPHHLKHADFRKIEEMVRDGFPTKIPVWKRGIAVRGLEHPTEFIVIKDKVLVSRGHATEDDAWASVKNAHDERMAIPKEVKPVVPTRPYLENVVRTGPDYRNGEDVSSEDFIRILGFSGIEFGNWVTQKERQPLLNHAWDALHDLADVIGVSPSTLSLGGRLSVALGARGTGKAAAHYEPALRVFNMTKINGAGAMAHEWGHALDHYLGDADHFRPSEDFRGATGYRNRVFKLDEYLINLTQTEARAWADMTTGFFLRTPTLDEHLERLVKAIETLQAEADHEIERKAAYDERVASNLQKPFRKYENSYNKWMTARLRKIEELQAKHDDVKRSGAVPENATHETNYHKEATKIGGGVNTYWTRPTELFARAFESYVFDQLIVQDRRSDYLVYGVEEDRHAGPEYKGNPYPVGMERELISDLIRNACAAVVDRLERDAPTLTSSPRLGI